MLAGKVLGTKALQLDYPVHSSDGSVPKDCAPYVPPEERVVMFLVQKKSEERYALFEDKATGLLLTKRAASKILCEKYSTKNRPSTTQCWAMYKAGW